jgi:hypothetical protein
MVDATPCETWPFSIRLLLLWNGPEAVMELIAAYCAAAPRGRTAEDDARGLIAYLRGRALRVPYLAALLDFEEALGDVAGTFDERTVAFGCNPVTLLGALEDRRLPEEITHELYFVDVSAKRIRMRASSLSATA